MNVSINVAAVKDLLLRCWSKKTSSLWTAENPARGQCGVTALVIQDRFGGEILKTKLDDGGWHYYNRINGRRYDFTSDQFGRAIDYMDVVTTREDALGDIDKDQYGCLSSALDEALR